MGLVSLAAVCAGALWLLRAPISMGCPGLAVNTMDSIICRQQRPDAMALLLSHQRPEHDMHRALQLVMLLLEYRRLATLSALCCEMSQQGQVTYMATLLAEAARFVTPLIHGAPLADRQDANLLPAARQRATFAI